MQRTGPLQKYEREYESKDDETEISEEAKPKRLSSFILDGDQVHTVWKPEHGSSLNEPRSIFERRQKLVNQVWATQQVLKLQCEDNKDQRNSSFGERKMWQKAIRNIINENAKTKTKKSSVRNQIFHDVVSQYEATMCSSSQDDPTAHSQRVRAEARKSLRRWRSQFMEYANPADQKLFSPTSLQFTVLHDNIPEEQEPMDKDTKM